MRRKEYIISYIAVIVLTLAFIGLALGMEHTEAKMLPLIIGGLVIILTAIGLSREFTVRPNTETNSAAETEEFDEAKGETWRRYAAVGAWMVGFFLMVYILGFIAAVFLFLLSYMKTHGTKWRIAITFAVLSTAIVYGLFVVLLKVNLHEGLLFG